MSMPGFQRSLLRSLQPQTPVGMNYGRIFFHQNGNHDKASRQGQIQVDYHQGYPFCGGEAELPKAGGIRTCFAWRTDRQPQVED